MRWIQSGLLFDLGFLTALLLAASVPLIVLQGSRQPLAPGVLMACCALGIGLFAAWVLLSRRFCAATPAATISQPSPRSLSQRSWTAHVVIGVLICALVLIAYFLPMRKSFSGGYDEFFHFAPNSHEFWSVSYGRGVGRPLVALCSYIGATLTPGRIEGLVLWTVSAYAGSAILLYLLLRSIVPQAGALAVTAAILFVVNTAEPMRYLVIWNACYYGTTLFLFLLATLLWIASFDARRRIGLVTACIVLALSFLGNEGIFPLTTLAPGLLVYKAILARRANPSLAGGESLDTKAIVVWCFAWLGTVALGAVNFLAYLRDVRTGSYQMQLAADAFHDPNVLLSNLKAQLEPTLNYLQRPRDFHGEYGYCWAATGAVTVLLLAWNWRSAPRADGSLQNAAAPGTRSVKLSPGQILAGMGLIVGALLLAIAPFLHTAGVWRSQFYAAPVQAVLVAGILCSGLSFLPGRWGRWCLLASVGILAGNATAKSLYDQDRVVGAVRFEKTVHIYEQVHAIAPQLPADALVLFILDDGAVTPLGANYGLCEMSRIVLGAPALQVNFVDPLTQATLTPAGVAYGSWKDIVPYDRVIAFKLSEDGTVVFLREFPEQLLPSGATKETYNPWPYLRATAPAEMPVMQTPFWSRRPADVVDARQGVVLGQGWHHLDWEGDDLCRWARSGAEIVVNSHGQETWTIELELEPTTFDPCGHDLVVLDDEEEIAATAHVSWRERLHLKLPTRTDRASVFHLHLRPVAAAPGDSESAFRVFADRDQARMTPQWWARNAVTASGIHLTRRWHGVEWFGRRVVRWLDDGGEIAITPNGRTAMYLDLASGPGVGAGTAYCKVLGPDGQVLAETSFRDETRLQVPLPANLPPGTCLRLRTIDFHRPAGEDSGIRNVGLLHCGWTDGQD